MHNMTFLFSRCKGTLGDIYKHPVKQVSNLGHNQYLSAVQTQQKEQSATKGAVTFKW